MKIDLDDFVKKLYQEANQKDLEISNGITYFLHYVKTHNRAGTLSYYTKMLHGIKEELDYYHVSFFSQIDNRIIMTLIDSWKSNGNSNSTINKKVTCIRTLSNRLLEDGMIDDPDWKFKKLKEEKVEIKTYDLTTLKKVYAFLKTKSNMRQLVFELMLCTGVRRTELTNIKRSNINLKNNCIWLDITKSGNPRYLFFDDSIKGMIQNELDSKPSSEWLFVFSDGRRVTPYSIDTFFEEIKKELSITLSPHKLRHTFATSILEAGGNIEQVRLLLGHTSYEMTKRYLHVNEKELKSTSLSKNPLALLY